MERDNKRINSMLSVMSDGDYKCGWVKGWIHIWGRKTHKFIGWTSFESFRSNFLGPRIYVCFYSDHISEVCEDPLFFYAFDKDLWLDHAQYIEDKVYCAFKRNNLDKLGV